MIVHDLNEVSLEHIEIVFVHCESADVRSFALRASEVGCTGFEFDRSGNGLPSIICSNKTAWLNEVRNKKVAFVSDDWNMVLLIQDECPSVTVYYLMDPPDSYLLLCPLLFLAVWVTLFYC